MSIGEKLKKARKDKDISIAQASSELNISREKIKALEEENYSLFASPFYARSFLKLYSRFLEVEADYNAEIEEEEVSPIFPGRDELQVPEKHLPSSLPKIIGIIIIAFIILYFSMIYFDMQTKVYIVPEETTVVNEYEPQTVEIKTVINQPTWVRVISDGRLITEELLSAGTTEYFNAEERLNIRVGYTPGMELYYRNRFEGEFSRVDIDRGSVGWVNELEFTKEFSK